MKKLDFCVSTKLVQQDTPQSEFVAEQHVGICRVDKKFYSLISALYCTYPVYRPYGHFGFVLFEAT